MQRVDEQVGAKHEHDGEGDLGDDERLPDPPASNGGAHRGHFVLQRRRDIDAAHHPDRREAEQQRRGNGDAAAQQQDPGIEMHVEIAHRRQRRHEQTQTRAGEQETGNRAEEAEDEALGQQLADEAALAGANGHADRHFARAGDRAGQLQVGQIGAGDRQDQHDQDHDDDNRRRELLAQAGDAVRARLELEPVARRRRPGARLDPKDALEDRCERVRRLLRRDARFEAGHARQPDRFAHVEHDAGQRGPRHRADRQPEIGGGADVDPEEARLRDADDRVRIAVDPDGLANHAGVPAEPTFP